jgi:hypothetical protein
MKIIQSILFLAFIIPMGISAQKKAVISIQNQSTYERKSAVVSVAWKTILENYPKIDTSNFVVINSATQNQIPYQLEHLGLAEIQNLLVQVDVKPNATVTLWVQKGKPNQFEQKTYARFVPERKDDFAWENDRIAFRTYGKAIEKTKEDAYGLDVWVKRTSKMVVNERYKLGDYHLDHGNGLDYYHVGFSLGAGNMAPFINDTIRYSANYHKWKVLDNGPLRSSFQLSYDQWDAGGILVSAPKTFSLDAGSQLNRIENVYSFSSDKPLPVVIGIVKRPENGIISLHEQTGIMGYWEPTHNKNGTTGVGTILSNLKTKMWIDGTQIVTKTEVKNNEPIVYYAGAVWDKAGKITTNQQWLEYLSIFQNQLKNPLIIKVK